MNLLVIEDDPKTARYLQRGLRESGFVVDVSHRGDDGLDVARSASFELIILDLMLPGTDGWSVLSSLRAAGNATPVLVLTARDAVQDRVRGLELGADDYLVKPFAFSELLARVRTILRRGPVLKPPEVRVADLVVSVTDRRVVRGARRIELSAKEFDVLHLMARRRGEALSRKEILHRIWGVNFEGDEQIVSVYVGKVRAKLDAYPSKPLLHTIRGYGYVLEPR